MKLEHFKEMLGIIRERDDLSQKIYDLGIDLSNIEDRSARVITMLLQYYYGVIGDDLISWALYEDVEKNIYSSSTGEVIAVLDTDEALWKYCEDMRITEYKEPEYKKPLTPEERMEMLTKIFKQ